MFCSLSWINFLKTYPSILIRKIYKSKKSNNYDKMGEVIKTKTVGDKIVYHVELKEEEARQLKNHMLNVHMFSLDLCNHNSKIIERG